MIDFKHINWLNYNELAENWSEFEVITIRLVGRDDRIEPGQQE